MDIGYRIKALREARGWKVAELAERADVHVNTLHNVEKGESDMLWATAEKVLSALGHTVLVIPKDANTLAFISDEVSA